MAEERGMCWWREEEGRGIEKGGTNVESRGGEKQRPDDKGLKEVLLSEQMLRLSET